LATRDPLIRALLIVMLLIGAVYLGGLLWQIAIQFADIILLFFLAWVISFVLEPLVGALERRGRLPRNLAVLLTYAAMLIVLSSAIVQVVPKLSQQVVLLVAELPLYADWLNREALSLLAWLSQQGINVAPEGLLSYQEVVRHVEQLGPGLVSNTLVVASSVASLLFQTFIVMILSYYMMLDGNRLVRVLLTTLPRERRSDARYFLSSVNRAFAGFIRGQMVQSAIYALGTALVLSVAGLKLVLLPSLIAGGLMLIPFAGPFLAMVLPLLLTAVERPDALLATLLALFVVQQIVVNVIAPRLMSQTVGLHPLLVFLAVLGGAKVAGIWGAVFGVPVVAVGAAMVSFYWAALERGGEEPAESGEQAQPARPAGSAAAGAAALEVDSSHADRDRLSQVARVETGSPADIAAARG
jgi:predicted PurR-regulated permease PerM